MSIDFLTAANKIHRPYRDSVEHFEKAPQEDGVVFIDDRRGTVLSTCAGKGLQWRLGKEVGSGDCEMIDLGSGIFFGYFDVTRTSNFTLRTRADDFVSFCLATEMHGVDLDHELIAERPSAWVISHGVEARSALRINAGTPSRGLILRMPRNMPNAILGIPLSTFPAAIRSTAIWDNTKFTLLSASAPSQTMNTLNDLLSCRYHGYARLEYARAKAIELLSHIMHAFDGLDDQFSNNYRLTVADISNLEEARRHLVARIDAPPTLGELAAIVGMSRSKFAESFKVHFGETVHVYARNLRMEKAKSILMQSDLPLAEISDRLGYCNPSYFSRVFRTHFGRSPTAFRKR